MPCGCQSATTNGPRSWVFVNARGEQQVYKTEIEARAAQVRAGGSGRIEVKAA